jgi:Holliday junction resolvase-like predicted endonuclease
MRNTVDEKVSTTFDSYHVGIAAESFAAGLLAHAGYEVLVQYGANQPLYDLVAVKGNRMLKISVKGSKDGGWVLTAGLKSGRTYHEAAEEWLSRHGGDLVFVFVQFSGVKAGEMPRVYVARANEVAAHLKSKKGGIGDTRFSEYQEWKSGVAKGVEDRIPDDWGFSGRRIDSV